MSSSVSFFILFQSHGISVVQCECKKDVQETLNPSPVMVMQRSLCHDDLKLNWGRHPQPRSVWLELQENLWSSQWISSIANENKERNFAAILAQSSCMDKILKSKCKPFVEIISTAAECKSHRQNKTPKSCTTYPSLYLLPFPAIFREHFILNNFNYELLCLGVLSHLTCTRYCPKKERSFRLGKFAFIPVWIPRTFDVIVWCSICVTVLTLWVAPPEMYCSWYRN